MRAIIAGAVLIVSCLQSFAAVSKIARIECYLSKNSSRPNLVMDKIDDGVNGAPSYMVLTDEASVEPEYYGVQLTLTHETDGKIQFMSTPYTSDSFYLNIFKWDGHAEGDLGLGRVLYEECLIKK